MSGGASAGTPSARRTALAVVSLILIPAAALPLAGATLLATAACGAICDLVQTIWLVGFALLAALAMLWLWTLVAVIRRRLPNALMVLLGLADAALLSALLAFAIWLG